jgi:hypothetical protein
VKRIKQNALLDKTELYNKKKKKFVAHWCIFGINIHLYLREDKDESLDTMRKTEVTENRNEKDVSISN